MKNYGKKIISLVLSAIMLFGVIVFSPVKTEAATTWKLTDGVLTISGTGAMSSYTAGLAPWGENPKAITSVVISEGVTSIGAYAFSLCPNLKSVTIASSVVSIGNGAFSHCEALESIEIPNGVTSIGKCAFYGCTSLQTVNIPESVRTIGSEAFNYCGNLTSAVYAGLPYTWGQTTVSAGNEYLINALEYDPLYSAGDANGDGKINGLDVIRIKNYLANYDYSSNTSTYDIKGGADMNNDGKINGLDVIRLKNYLANLDYNDPSTIISIPPKTPVTPVAIDYVPRTIDSLGRQVRVTCVGDSLTYGDESSDNTTKSYPARLGAMLGDDYRVVNVGVKGSFATLNSSSPSSYYYTNAMQTALLTNPDILIVMFGTNDANPYNTAVSSNTAMADRLNGYINGMNTIIGAFDATRMNPEVYIGISPWIENRSTMAGFEDNLNYLVNYQRSYAENKGYEYIECYGITQGHEDYYADGLHLTDDGYYEIAKAFYNKIFGSLANIKVGANDLKNYKIVVANGDLHGANAALMLNQFLAEKCGYILPVIADTAAVGAYEVRLGKNSRNTAINSADVSFTVTDSGRKLNIISGRSETSVSAVLLFIETYLDNANAETVIPSSLSVTKRSALLSRTDTVKIACVGDSLTAGTGATQSTQSYPARLDAKLPSNFVVTNYGVGGTTMTNDVDETYNTAHYLSYTKTATYTQSKNSNPDIVIMMFGANDSVPLVCGRIPASQRAPRFLTSAHDNITSYKTLASSPDVFLCTPVQISKIESQANRKTNMKDIYLPLVKQAAKAENVPLFDVFANTMDIDDLYSDGVHLTAVGYDYLAGVMLQNLVSYYGFN
ncbi:MAG: leucine-rich repeat protein [Clostridia bacterium]|nr:leucine-rich repeat protein [Clostridia bacterium]